MSHSAFRLLAAAALLSASVLPAAEQHGPFEWSGIERMVAIGDVHGSYDKLLQLLDGTGLVDDKLAWSGGDSHLVFLGDLTDRGPLERPVLDLVRKLETEAETAGGRVHVLLGNHEVINLVGDFRYVEGQGYSDFAADEQAGDRDAGFARFQKVAVKAGIPRPQIRAAFQEHFPAGFFGRLRAFSATGTYGAWLLEKPAVVKINGYLFLHGGLTDQVAALGLEGINEGVRKSVKDYLDNRSIVTGTDIIPYDEAYQAAEALVNSKSAQRKTPEKVEAAKALLEHFDGLAFSPSGPLWYRGNSVENEQTERVSMQRVFDSLDARGVVVAHTPTGTGRINSRLNGRILRTDVGMAYGREPLCIVLEGGRISAYDPATNGSVALIAEPPQGERWSDIQEQLPDPQLERFLERASVVDRTPVHRVVRGERREGEVWSLEYKGLELRGIFLFVDEPSGSDPNAPVRRYVHEVASYKLDRLMDLGLVPVTVVRELEGRAGSLQIWVQASINTGQLIDYGRLDLLEGFKDEIMRAYIFNALIAGRERLDFGRMVLPKERRVMLADNTKAFSLSPELEELEPDSPELAEYLPDECVLDADFELGLRLLDRDSVKSEVGDYLSEAQIDALLARRDRILESCIQ